MRFNDRLGLNALNETLLLDNSQDRREPGECSFSSNGFALLVCPEPSKKNVKQALKYRNYFIRVLAKTTFHPMCCN